METPTIAIELSDSAIKIVVGYLYDNKPVILYATTFDNKGLVNGAKILDAKSLSEILKNASKVQDEEARARFLIPRAILLLPPTGLEVFEGNRRTLVASNNNQIGTIDIANLTNMLCKRKALEDYSYISIVPQKYYLDNNSILEKMPLNYVSSSIGVKALMHMLPTSLINSYKSSLEVAGIRVSKMISGPAAIASLLSRTPNIPNTYFYVDIGSSYTSITLIKKLNIYNSITFPIGGDMLTKNIAESFNIGYVDAEKIKRRYGYDTKILSFDPIICNGSDNDGNKIYFSIVDLKNITNSYLDSLFSSIDENIKRMVSNYPEDKRDFPIIFGGAGSRLANLLTVFNEKYPNYKANKIPLNVLGVRHEKYLNCVGAICSTKDNNDLLEFNQNRIITNTQASALNKKSPEKNNGSVI